MDVGDLMEILVLAIAGVLWLLGKLFGRKDAPAPAPQDEDAGREHDAPVPRRRPHARPVPVPTPAPAPSHPHPRRPHVFDMPRPAPPSGRMEELRPAPIVSSRHHGHDEPLSDYGDRRGLPSRTEDPADAPAPAAAAPTALSRVSLADAMIWREVLGPPVSRRPRGVYPRG